VYRYMATPRQIASAAAAATAMVNSMTLMSWPSCRREAAALRVQYIAPFLTM
jgi:hypothetical protein